jgi:hypothetical protein
MLLDDAKRQNARALRLVDGRYEVARGQFLPLGRKFSLGKTNGTKERNKDEESALGSHARNHTPVQLTRHPLLISSDRPSSGCIA